MITDYIGITANDMIIMRILVVLIICTYHSMLMILKLSKYSQFTSRKHNTDQPPTHQQTDMRVHMDVRLPIRSIKKCNIKNNLNRVTCRNRDKETNIHIQYT